MLCGRREPRVPLRRQSGSASPRPVPMPFPRKSCPARGSRRYQLVTRCPMGRAAENAMTKRGAEFLLPRPGGFECFGSLLEQPKASDLPVLNGEHESAPRCHFDPVAPPHVGGIPDHDFGPRPREVVYLQVGILKRRPELVPEGPTQISRKRAAEAAPSRTSSNPSALVVLRRALRLILRTGLRTALEMTGVTSVRVVPERGAGGDSGKRKRACQGDRRHLPSHLAHASTSLTRARLPRCSQPPDEFVLWSLPGAARCRKRVRRIRCVERGEVTSSCYLI